MRVLTLSVLACALLLAACNFNGSEEVPLATNTPLAPAVADATVAAAENPRTTPVIEVEVQTEADFSVALSGAIDSVLAPGFVQAQYISPRELVTGVPVPATLTLILREGESDRNNTNIVFQFHYDTSPGTYPIDNSGILPASSIGTINQVRPADPTGNTVEAARFRENPAGTITLETISPILSGSFDFTVSRTLPGGNLQQVTARGTFSNIVYPQAPGIGP